jgi:hypothetical protein
VGADLKVISDDTLPLLEAAAKVVGNSRFGETGELEDLQSFRLFDGRAGQYLQHPLVDNSYPALRIDGYDSNRCAGGEKSISFLEGVQCGLGDLTAVLDFAKLGYLLTHLFQFSDQTLVRAGFGFHTGVPLLDM